MNYRHINIIRQIGLVCALGSMVAVCISAWIAQDYTKLYPAGLPLMLLAILWRKPPESRH